MKVNQTTAIPEALAHQLIEIGASLARLRIARRMRQEDAAIRGGISRRTAGMIEKGSPQVAIGQIARYLDAIVPGKTIQQLLRETDPSVIALSSTEQRRRARTLTEAERAKLDF